MVARTESEYRFYISWLADYLYRPEQSSEAAISLEEARAQIIGIEMEIAHQIWESPGEDYPTEEQLSAAWPGHADFLHRAAISRILSRVPSHDDRVKVLECFYDELVRDMTK